MAGGGGAGREKEGHGRGGTARSSDLLLVAGVGEPRGGGAPWPREHRKGRGAAELAGEDGSDSRTTRGRKEGGRRSKVVAGAPAGVGDEVQERKAGGYPRVREEVKAGIGRA